MNQILVVIIFKLKTFDSIGANVQVFSYFSEVWARLVELGKKVFQPSKNSYSHLKWTKICKK